MAVMSNGNIIATSTDGMLSVFDQRGTLVSRWLRNDNDNDYDERSRVPVVTKVPSPDLCRRCPGPL